MKAYSSYMDAIAVDGRLHAEIMRKIAQKTVQKAAWHAASKYRKKATFRMAGLVACAAVLLLCVVAIPGLFTGLWGGPTAPHSAASSNALVPAGAQSSPQGSPQSGAQPQTSMPHPAGAAAPAPSDEEAPLYPLTLNKAGAQLGANIVIPGHFWYKLTDEQLAALLPAFPFSVAATAHHRGDGSLFSVVAYEVDAAGEAKTVQGLYGKTEIVFAPGEVVDDVVYEYEPIVSDVGGVPVLAGVFDFNENDGLALYSASFKLDDIAYDIKLYDGEQGESGLNRLTELVNAIVQMGAPDLSVLSNPVIPPLRDETLTLDEARAAPDFGAWLPQALPAPFRFESAQRFLNQESNSLSAFWTAGYNAISWRVSQPTAVDRAHIVSVDEREKYDLSLYPIPRAGSVPAELREFVAQPVFLAEEFTLESVKARAYPSNEPGDAGWRVDFSVLYGDIVVSINCKGVSPEEVWEMVSNLGA